MAIPSVFGEIPGVPPNTMFDSREGLRAAGLHRHKMAGISGSPTEGADAIVISGGYPDDRDFGQVIIYTGQGGNGNIPGPQTLTKGNLALVRSEEQGLPVRVIRGAHSGSEYSPARGYRYDGLYTVTKHWTEIGQNGYLVYRFVLEQAETQVHWIVSPDTSQPPSGNLNPNRIESVTQRIVRNTAVTQWIKDLYAYQCQICNITLEIEGGAYAEGAHIRALGRPHNGADVVSNVLCLCPNHHVLFDKGALFIHERMVHRSVDLVALDELTSDPSHRIDSSATQYHREKFAQVRDFPPS